ncbi:MAG TPA: aspartyl protease family protein [Usitatibacter sp.]|nr:aspartyl protease family protein [Usitatibacter sp.]
MRTASVFAALLSVALLAGCTLRYAVFGFPEARVSVAGTLPFELRYRQARGGLVILTGRVNGKADVDFILDTGAPVTVFIEGLAPAALALDSSRARRMGAGDNAATPTGDIQDGFGIDFGGVALAGLTAVVVPLASMPCNERFREIGFGGVIGADLFRRFVVEIDPATRRVRLHDPGSWRAPPGAASVPIEFRGGHPFVKAGLALADGRRIEIPMNVDTGLNRALTLVAGSHAAIAMPEEGTVRQSCLVNGVREEREGAAVTVELAGVRLPVAKPVYSDRPNPVDDARTSTIGVELFRDRRLFIDFPGKRLVV